MSQEVSADLSAENVVLADYNREADALTGTILAAVNDGPLLLIHRFDESIKTRRNKEF